MKLALTVPCTRIVSAGVISGISLIGSSSLLLRSRGPEIRNAGLEHDSTLDRPSGSIVNDVMPPQQQVCLGNYSASIEIAGMGMLTRYHGRKTMMTRRVASSGSSLMSNKDDVTCRVDSAHAICTTLTSTGKHWKARRIVVSRRSIISSFQLHVTSMTDKKTSLTASFSSMASSTDGCSEYLILCALSPPLTWFGKLTKKAQARRSPRFSRAKLGPPVHRCWPVCLVDLAETSRLSLTMPPRRSS